MDEPDTPSCHSSALPPRIGLLGGGSYWKVVRSPSKPPYFFRPFLAPETHHFKPFSSSSSSRAPTFSFSEKLCIFKPDFGSISASETQILSKIRSEDPSFKPKKKKTPETLLLKTWAARRPYLPKNFSSTLSILLLCRVKTKVGCVRFKLQNWHPFPIRECLLSFF